MNIFEYDGVFADDVNLPDIVDIKTSGITVRSGNKILTFTATSEEILPTEELEKEYSDKLEEAYKSLKESADTYKNQLKEAFDIKKNALQDKIDEYTEKSNAISVLPLIKDKHVNNGLFVSSTSHGGLKWHYTCVYAPKYINNNIIDPSFAKRLMTPVSIEITTNSDKQVINMRVLTVIGYKKFRHYHSLSSTSDCWGEFQYSGVVLDTPDDALVFAKKVILLLETINEFSLGTRNPKGLSRFDTLKKHLVGNKEEVKETKANTRSTRSGFDMDVNTDDATNMVWTT